MREGICLVTRHAMRTGKKLCDGAEQSGPGLQAVLGAAAGGNTYLDSETESLLDSDQSGQHVRGQKWTFCLRSSKKGDGGVLKLLPAAVAEEG